MMILRRFLNWLSVKLLGKRMALMLRLYRPPHVSDGNMVVYSYVHSVDEALRDNAPEAAGEE